jgi:hypothetical protein
MPPELDTINPLSVVIAEEHPGFGDWDIQVSDTAVFPTDGKTHGQKMLDRIGAFNPGLGQQFNDKKVINGKAQPHFLQHPGHKPIVVRPQETVIFRCDKSFRLSVQRDPNVIPDLDAPENPFGWTRVQRSEPSGSGYQVVATATSTPGNQRFYKCTAWVVVNGLTVLVDPDCIFG